MNPLSPKNPYTKMQRAAYAEESAKWTPDNRDPVVGSFDSHNEWTDYDLLFPFDKRWLRECVALDFGCGPGRMMAKYSSWFKQIDGADIDERNLVNALAWLTLQGVSPNYSLFQTSGIALDGIEKSTYDIVFSTICLQHIPVWSIRHNLFSEFYRVLKPGGYFTAQMGFGRTPDKRARPYSYDVWDAELTNGGCDVSVTESIQLEDDLVGLGFTDFGFVVRHTGPGDWHPGWIFFRARKPPL